VGTAGLDEILIFALTEKTDTTDALARMRDQVPAGAEIRSLHLVDTADAPRPIRACYQVALGGPAREPEEFAGSSESDRQALLCAVERFRQSETWPVQRVRPTRRGSVVRTVDLRPLVDELELAEDALRMVLPVGPSGSARPVDVLAAVGLPAEHWAHRLRRTRVDWNPPLPEQHLTPLDPKKGL